MFSRPGSALFFGPFGRSRFPGKVNIVGEGGTSSSSGAKVTSACGGSGKARCRGSS
jgi:hypothetical protein